MLGISAFRVLTCLQVITVPAHFDERQKGATLKAASMAGLPESRVQLLQGGGA